jgi:hypothetical protein
MRPAITNWIPAGFCACISLIALFTPSWSAGALNPVFLSSLPMCFYFVGVVTSELRSEVDRLRKQLAELEQQRPG